MPLSQRCGESKLTLCAEVPKCWQAGNAQLLSFVFLYFPYEGFLLSQAAEEEAETPGKLSLTVWSLSSRAPGLPTLPTGAPPSLPGPEVRALEVPEHSQFGRTVTPQELPLDWSVAQKGAKMVTK